MTVLDPHTPHQHLQDIQFFLTQNRNILVSWIKAHVGYRGNEEADTLAKKAITEDVVVKALKSRCELKQHLQELFLRKWQNLWDNGNTGRSVHKELKTVHIKPVFWTSEEILFVTGHGPFPSFLTRFHLSDSDSCACGEVGDPMHSLCEILPIDSLSVLGNLILHWKVCGTKAFLRIRIQEKNNKHD
ncbi:hypothetical protein AVEN_176946-1 [Araneus ventricosus]|uniref:RNase H type-1 domain-containing protein n=1 Tax=Araneus ventricosus TaxID=182803 RepID=A0A4Y2K802_ARAVE|nr:hypothetical protein AVEN_176946-1 [Araneus ventricosus]